MLFSVALSALAAFLSIATVYAFLAIGRTTERVYTAVCLALLIAIAGLCGFALLDQIEHGLAVAARV